MARTLVWLVDVCLSRNILDTPSSVVPEEVNVLIMLECSTLASLNALNKGTGMAGNQTLIVALGQRVRKM